jgi:hypothetical protein
MVTKTISRYSPLKDVKQTNSFADPDPSDPYGMFLSLLDPYPDPLVSGHRSS